MNTRAVLSALCPHFREQQDLKKPPCDYSFHSQCRIHCARCQNSQENYLALSGYILEFSVHIRLWWRDGCRKQHDPNPAAICPQKNNGGSSPQLRALSRGAALSIRRLFDVKGLAEQERGNKEQMGKELRIWSAGEKFKEKFGFKVSNVGMGKDDLSKLQRRRRLQMKHWAGKKRCESPQWLQTESRGNSDVGGGDYATQQLKVSVKHSCQH